MIPACRAIVIVLCVLTCASLGAAMLPERSISTSRQFLVYGPDIHLRGAICDLAERTKQDILQLIGKRDAWSTPIVINARYPEANLPEIPRAALSLGQTGFGLKMQLDLTMVSDVRQPEIRRELLNALLVEMMYRQGPALHPGIPYALPPKWLIDGLQAIGSNMPGGLAGPGPAPKSSLREFLRHRPPSLDTLGRSLDGVYSAALLELLTHFPDGRQRLARFISDIPNASDDTMAHLQVHFPELIDGTGTVQQEWLSQIARLSSGQCYQLLSAQESERILNRLLSLKISKAGLAKNYQLHEFPIFLRDLSAKPALIRLDRDLSVLATQASPIYRPAICEYGKIATLLARRRTKGIAQRLARLSALRKALAAQTRKIDDYMNWFEAAKSVGPSGLFADYTTAAKLAERSDRRRDPISVYLDVLETEFQN